MPEGDTIHQIARVVAPKLERARVERVELWGEADERLAGRRVERVEARGKWLLIRFEPRDEDAPQGEPVLLSHLGMHGSWHRYGPGESWRRPPSQAGVVLRTGEHDLVCFRPKEAEVVPRGGLRYRDVLRRVGPDLTSPEVDLDAVVVGAGRVVGPRTVVTDLLLDQRPASGIGNVYKSEVLFLEAVHPLRRAAELEVNLVRSLYERAHDLLRANLAGGFRETRDPADGRGRLWVYERADAECLRCGDAVRTARLGRDHRSTYWCPTCQVLPDGTG